MDSQPVAKLMLGEDTGFEQLAECWANLLHRELLHPSGQLIHSVLEVARMDVPIESTLNHPDDGVAGLTDGRKLACATVLATSSLLRGKVLGQLGDLHGAHLMDVFPSWLPVLRHDDLLCAPRRSCFRSLYRG